MAESLSSHLGAPVATVGDCVGPSIAAAVPASGSVLLLENLRFHKAEEKNEPEFAAALAQSCGGVRGIPPPP